ncbi:MAG: GntP family permease [Bacteroidota bacterium]
MIALVLLGILVFIVVATVRFKMHPVFSLTISALVAGMGLGLSPEMILKTMGEGLGKTLSGIALVIAFGSVIGIYLEKTGATQVLAQTVLRGVGLRKSPLALNLAGYLVSIPVFCDSGFIILSSLNKALSKRSGIPVMVFSIALATGLYAAHVFVPPTPGPLAAAAILEADLGMVILLGLSISIPVSVMGYVWANWMGKRIKGTKTESDSTEKEDVVSDLPKIKPYQAFLPLFAPIVLIAFKSIASYPSHPFGEGLFLKTLDFIGNPVVALLVGVVLAVVLARNISSPDKGKWIPEALGQAGSIVLITGAGGAFGAVLRTIDVGQWIGTNYESGLAGLAITFGIAALLKTAQGSSTVSIITTSAIVAPLLGAFGLESALDKVLVVLSVGAGAMTVSHVNDSYFWVVSQFSGLTTKQGLQGLTLATLLQGLTGFTSIIVLYLIL